MKEDKIVLASTEDFSIFKPLENNRKLNRVQINKLLKTLRLTPNFTFNVPIIVNENMEIIDGQHRLAAHKQYAEKEGVVVPIYYIIRPGIGIEDARSMNSGMKPWIPVDYARVFAPRNENYRLYLKTFNEMNFNHETIMRYMSGLNLKSETFREGKFIIKDYAEAMLLLNRLQEIGQVVEAANIGDINYWRNRAFTAAAYVIMTAENYDHDRFLEQLDKYGHWLRPVKMRTKSLLATLKNIYNRGTANKLNLK